VGHHDDVPVVEIRRCGGGDQLPEVVAGAHLRQRRDRLDGEEAQASTAARPPARPS
jgi:hypothetical protein